MEQRPQQVLKLMRHKAGCLIVSPCACCKITLAQVTQDLRTQKEFIRFNCLLQP